jgi:hypothetical protein
MSKIKKEEEIYIGKEVAFYQTILEAWIQNRMEFDKTILTISFAAIGFLFINDTNQTCLEWFFWILSVICFAISIFLILKIFRKNSDLLSLTLMNSDNEKLKKLNKSLDIFTKIAHYSLMMGVLIVFIKILILKNL